MTIAGHYIKSPTSHPPAWVLWLLASVLIEWCMWRDVCALANTIRFSIVPQSIKSWYIIFEIDEKRDIYHLPAMSRYRLKTHAPARTAKESLHIRALSENVTMPGIPIPSRSYDRKEIGARGRCSSDKREGKHSTRAIYYWLPPTLMRTFEI